MGCKYTNKFKYFFKAYPKVKYTPHQYQQHCTEHVINNAAAGLFVGMGLGKTVSTLTAISQLMYDDLEVDKVLVIAPKLVAQRTWTAEIEKWEHLHHLKVSKILGSEAERKAALLCKADIYLINRENVVWLIGYYGSAFPFDMVVIDELSSFKSAKSERFKALRKIRPLVKRVVGLTGTPAPNGLIDLWPQLYLLDRGERLGTTLTGYRERYFTKNAYTPFGKYELIKDSNAEKTGENIFEKRIYDKISDICISMKAEDYLQLPKRVDSNVFVDFTSSLQEKYNDFEREQVLALEDNEQISAINAAALTGKLLQFSNGAVYDESKNYLEIHDLKLQLLAEDVEAANGNPFLLFFQFRHDVDRIKKHLKHLHPEELDSPKQIDKWNKGEIPFLLAHAASAGHGLNMQDGGNLMGWFGVPWSLELYLQAVARLDRQGQKKPVINRRYAIRGTMDERVMNCLENKNLGQNALIDAIKAIVKKYK